MSVVTTTDAAIDVALSARRAMQLLRDSSLPGQPFYERAAEACRAIDAVVIEAQRISRERGTEAA